MRDAIVGVLTAVAATASIGGALVLAGAVIAVARVDHRNPVAYRWIAWHERHTAASGRRRPSG